MDQSLFAAPHGISQRTTSFIASQRQGIHRIPLRHLIALMIDVRPPTVETADERHYQKDHVPGSPGTYACRTHPIVDAPPARTEVHKPARHLLAGPSQALSDAFPLHDDQEPACAVNPWWIEPQITRNRHGRTGACPGEPSGGARRDRTDDLKLAKLALSQLSYGPSRNQ